MSVTIDCGEGRHDVCLGAGTQHYLIPQLNDGERFDCSCGCHRSDPEPVTDPPPEAVSERWTIYVCPACGAQGVMDELQRRTGGVYCYCRPNKGDPTRCNEVEVVRAPLLDAERERYRALKAELGDAWMARNEAVAENRALVDFVQRVACSKRAVCKAEHHAGTCRGAVALADAAARVLSGLGEELRSFERPFTFEKPCPVCGGDEYVIGEVWLGRWVHARCLEVLSASLPPQEPK